MKVGVIVNNPLTEKTSYSTTMMVSTFLRMGHTVYVAGVDDLGYEAIGEMCMHAIELKPAQKYAKLESVIETYAASAKKRIKTGASELDVLMLRNDPAGENFQRTWAKTAGVNFGQFATQAGCIVLNDPFSLSNAQNKLYFQYFPEEVRPKTIITRSASEIRDFYEANRRKIILKPIQGSGGHGVFIVTEANTANLNQIIETLSSEGYIIAQEYLPDASKGDIRMMLMNGKPMIIDGKYAAFTRVSEGDDIRNNISAGGHFEPAEVTEHMLHLANLVAPKLIHDGMFLVGLDIAGKKLMEINVFSPGGINNSNTLGKVNFAELVVASIENKVAMKKIYGDKFANAYYASL